MIHSFTVTLGAKYLTGTKLSVLFKNINLHQSKNYKNDFKNSNIWGIWPLGHIGHVTYNFRNMLFIRTGIFDDKLHPHILSVGTTANAALNRNIFPDSVSLLKFIYFLFLVFWQIMEIVIII